MSVPTGEPCEEQGGKLVSIVIHGEEQGNLKGYRLFTMIVRNDLDLKKKKHKKVEYISEKCHRCVPPLRSQRLELDVTLWV